MPFCKTYQINNREEGKAAQRDQSYRSCIITLLIFFFMCLILIFACTPWKVQNERERNHYTEHELQHHYQERTNKTTITVLSTTQKIPTTILSRTLEPTKAIITSTDSGSTEDTRVITKDYSKKNVKGSRHFERYLKNTSGDEIPSTSISQENTKDYNTEKVFKNTDIKKKSSSFSTLSLDSVPNNNDTPSTSQNGTISTTTLKYVTTVDNYITLLTTLSLPNLKNNTINPDYSAKNNSENSQLKETSDNVISTSSIQLNLEENKDIKNSTTKYSKYEEFDAMEYKTILTNKNSIPYVSNYTNATIFYDNKTSPVVPIIHNVTNFMPIANIILSDENTNICETGHCKQIASRMLSYMNHSADPCDDFYEYACGGFEVNSQLVDEDLVRKSIINFSSQFVLPKHDNLKDYCLRVATNLLQLEASSLYISSFSDHEITYMNNMIEKTFNKLKQTLSMKMQNAQWAIKEGREELLKKINGLKLALPVVSYFKNRDSLYNDYNISEIILCDNYFNNSMILLKRYRTLMYTELKRQVGDPKQVWTYYAMPFQSKARVIYPLNLIVIPYGIIDWSLLNKESLSFDYLLLATLGNLIAHQIAHHFDTNGIHYWNQTRNTRDSLMFENEFTDTHFDDYINCQKKNLYQEFMNMTLPFTNQIVFYKIPRLTLNERLSEIMGLRLAYDTLALMKSDAKGLPWIQLRIDQLFYLAYAQMYCTKIPLTSSYISLYESEDLPNRIRVFVSASNDELLAEAWNCPLGSQIAPIDICSAFPYIDTKET